MFDKPDDVVDWFCKKSERKAAYAHLRSASLFLNTKLKMFQACLELAKILREDVDMVRQLLFYPNWRHAVIGNMVIVLNQDSRFEDDYVEWFKRGGGAFPSPFAAGWLILNTGRTAPELETHLTNLSKRTDIEYYPIFCRTTLSIYAALRILSSKQAKEFERTELYRGLTESNDYPDSIKAVEGDYAVYGNYLMREGS